MAYRSPSCGYERAADAARQPCAARRPGPNQIGSDKKGRFVKGPAVAGVIGRNRFAYDLWGDTVNVAARIEQAAKPNEIYLSNATRERLGADFLCTAIGDVEARGAGRIAIWRLDCEQSDESSAILT